MAIIGGALLGAGVLGGGTGALIGAGVGALGKSLMGGGGGAAGQVERIDLEGLSELARDQARQNVIDSLGLEEEFTPEVAQARREALEGLLGDIQSGGSLGADLEDRLTRALSTEDVPLAELERSELLQGARDEALADLKLGGDLPQELQNLISRTAAGNASGSGFLGSQIGRDINARDLGRTSFDIRNQRIATAGQLGAQEEATNLQQQGLRTNVAMQNRQFQQQNLLDITNQLQNLRQNEFANRFGLAQLTQSIERPVAGLDPGQLASASISDVNSANQMLAMDAQNRAAQSAGNKQLLGSLGAAGIMAFACWVAREVYGADNPKWMLFREWLLDDAPVWFRELYLEYGERFAEWLKGKTVLKWAIRKFMDGRIKSKFAHNPIMLQQLGG